MSESLAVYYGGLLNSPVPLECSLNWCSTGCQYCYANLNSPKRTADTKQIMGLLSSFHDRNTLAATLLKQGYPVLCSTHVDFFAKSNEDIGITLLDIMQDMGVPYMLATKGGDRFTEFISRSKPCVIYFSVATLSDRISNQVEPNAPSPSERLRMIETAIAYGHKVVAGINPCVPDWIDDPLALATALKNAGVSGIISQPLHLNNNQIKQIPEQGLAAIGERVLKQAKIRDRDPVVRAFNLKIREVCASVGLELYRVGQNIRSDFYQPWKDIYPKLYPTGQDFVNHCYDSGKQEGDVITWQDWRDFVVPKLPSGVLPLWNHLAATQNKDWCGKHIDKTGHYMTYEALLEMAWCDHAIAFSPVNETPFRWLGDFDEQKPRGWWRFVDENDLPVLVFRPNEISNEVFEEI